MADLPLVTTLRVIVRELEALEVRYALVGGLALMAWLPPRATSDVDVVVAVSPDDAPQVAKLLAKRIGGIPSARPIRFRSGAQLQRVILQRPEGEVLLDLMLATPGHLTDVLARRVRVPHVAGELHVATAEDLLLMKLVAWRPKDVADAHQLASIEGLDWAYVRRVARRLRVTTRLTRVTPRARRTRRRR